MKGYISFTADLLHLNESHSWVLVHVCAVCSRRICPENDYAAFRLWTLSFKVARRAPIKNNERSESQSCIASTYRLYVNGFFRCVLVAVVVVAFVVIAEFLVFRWRYRPSTKKSKQTIEKQKKILLYIHFQSPSIVVRCVWLMYPLILRMQKQVECILCVCSVVRLFLCFENAEQASVNWKINWNQRLWQTGDSRCEMDIIVDADNLLSGWRLNVVRTMRMCSCIISSRIRLKEMYISEQVCVSRMRGAHIDGTDFLWCSPIWISEAKFMHSHNATNELRINEMLVWVECLAGGRNRTLAKSTERRLHVCNVFHWVSLNTKIRLKNST